MNVRDEPVVEENPGYLRGFLLQGAKEVDKQNMTDEPERPGFQKKGFLMQVANRVDESATKGIQYSKGVIRAGEPQISRQQIIAPIQTAQTYYIISALLQFSLTIIIIGLFMFLELFDLFGQVAFIVQFILLIIFIITIASVRLGGPIMLESPINVVLFIIHGSVRLFWFSYLTFTVEFIKFELVTLLLSIDFLLVLIFFRWDLSNNVENCFRVKDQPWRILFIISVQIFCIGIILPIETVEEAILWLLIIFLIYQVILFSVQIVEFRLYLINSYNSWLMATVIFDSDIFFPCEMVAYATGMSNQKSKLN